MRDGRELPGPAKGAGVYVFGDSLVDAGNALELAEWYDGLPLQELPEGAPTEAALLALAAYVVSGRGLESGRYLADVALLILAMAISMAIGTGMRAVILAIAVTRIPFGGRVIRTVVHRN